MYYYTTVQPYVSQSGLATVYITIRSRNSMKQLALLFIGNNIRGSRSTNMVKENSTMVWRPSGEI